MPHTEVMLWHEYARKHGGLPLQRLNFMLASLCTMFSAANGGKATLQDFLPGLPAPEPSPEPDFEADMNKLYDFLDKHYGY